MRDTLTRSVLSELRERLPHIREITTKEFVMGIVYTGVRTSTDDVGLANTPLEDFSPESCDIGSKAGKLTNMPTVELAECAESWDLSERVAGLAALNAISQVAIKASGHQISKRYGDAIESAKIGRGDVVILVGNMRHSVEKLKRRAREVLVLERNVSLRDRGVFPDTAAESIIPRGDVVFVTGATLCNGTVDRILELSKNAREVILLGTSAGIFPPAAFRRGVTAVCPIEILDPEGAMRAVSEGGGNRALRKVARTVVYESRSPRRRNYRGQS